jgi:hypothetical protein
VHNSRNELAYFRARGNTLPVLLPLPNCISSTFSYRIPVSHASTPCTGPHECAVTKQVQTSPRPSYRMLSLSDYCSLGYLCCYSDLISFLKSHTLRCSPLKVKPTFRMNKSPPSSGSNKQSAWSDCYQLHSGLLPLLILDHVDGGDVTPKRRVDYQLFHTRKIEIIMTTTVRSPNCTCAEECNSSAICTASTRTVNSFYLPF